MAKPKDPIVGPLLGLFSEDAKERERRLSELHTLVIADAVDVRDTNSVVAWLLLEDPSDAVRSAALRLVVARAHLGCDVGFAVPALLRISQDEASQAEARKLADAALRLREERTPMRRFLDG